MSSTTPRIVAALVIVVACVAVWAITRAPEPAPSAPDLAVDGGEEIHDAVEVSASAPPRSRPSSTPTSPSSSSAPEEPIVREAPGPAPWARGLDLPAPEVPDVAPVPDPAHLRYREDSDHVAPETQVAYLENSLRMIDGTVGALEAELEQRGETSSEAARALSTRIARMRQARGERASEIEALRARIGPGAAPVETAPREGI